MTWTIKAGEYKKLLSFDQGKSRLKFDLDFVADIWTNKGRLHIYLSENTNFLYENGKMAHGWNGDETHIGSIVRLEKGYGGTLLYLRHRHDYDRSKPYKEIEIKIEAPCDTLSPDEIVIKEKEKPKKKESRILRLLLKKG